MNIVYGVLAMAVSLVVMRVFHNTQESPVRSFIKAFSVEFVCILFLGLIFQSLDLGFFSREHDFQDELLRIAGLAAFLALLLGLRAFNRAREVAPDQNE